MWLNQLFSEEPVDFERRCRRRIWIGIGDILLGLLSVAAMVLLESHGMIGCQGPGTDDFIRGFYGSLGAGLIGGGIVSVIRNRKYLSDPQLRREREVVEKDERNRLLGLRCWAYTGYSMFLALYAGILVSGFISMTVAKVLMAIAAGYAFLLLVFRFFLSRVM